MTTLLKQVDGVEEVLRGNPNFVDIYTSTDVGEAAFLLRRLGFREDKQFDPYLEESFLSVRLRNSNGLNIDVMEVELEEDLRYRKGTGFPVMSKIRITLDGIANIKNILGPIARLLRRQHQNIALISNIGRIYPAPSRYYEVKTRYDSPERMEWRTR